MIKFLDLEKINQQLTSPIIVENIELSAFTHFPSIWLEFKLKVENSELFSIIHTQEQPEFRKVLNIKMKKDYSILNGKTVFVIDDKTHSTCLFSGEY